MDQNESSEKYQLPRLILALTAWIITVSLGLLLVSSGPRNSNQQLALIFGSSSAQTEEKLQNTDLTIWIIAGGGGVIIIFLLYLIVRLTGRMKKEEKEINQLEDFIEQERERHRKENEGTKKEKPLPAIDVPLEKKFSGTTSAITPLQPHIKAGPNPPNLDPQLLEYIRTAKAQGVNDKTIAEELRRVGWAENLIQDALRYRG